MANEGNREPDDDPGGSQHGNRLLDAATRLPPASPLNHFREILILQQLC